MPCHIWIVVMIWGRRGHPANCKERLYQRQRVPVQQEHASPRRKLLRLQHPWPRGETRIVRPTLSLLTLLMMHKYHISRSLRAKGPHTSPLWKTLFCASHMLPCPKILLWGPTKQQTPFGGKFLRALSCSLHMREREQNILQAFSKFLER